MSFNYRDIHSQLSVTNQPQPSINLGSLDFKKSIPIDEKSLVTSLENSHHHLCELEDGQISFSKHRTSNNIRLKRFLLSAIFSLVVLGGLLALSCVEWHGLPLWEVRGADLMGRALHADTGNLTGTPIEKIKNFISHSQLIPLIHDLHIHNLIIYAISIAYLILIIIGIPVVLLIAILVTGCCSSGQLSEENNYSIRLCSF